MNDPLLKWKKQAFSKTVTFNSFPRYRKQTPKILQK